MPEKYISLSQMQEILLRTKAEFLSMLDASISEQIERYDSKWTIHESIQSLLDDSGDPILDDTDEEIQARLLLVTL
jgi:hypothetical protein